MGLTTLTYLLIFVIGFFGVDAALRGARTSR